MVGPVAQWSEQGTHNPLVVGSIPTWPTLREFVALVCTMLRYTKRMRRCDASEGENK